MYYIEYIKRNDGVSLERFQSVVRKACEEWSALFPDDELDLFLLAARTQWLGPEPPYIMIWRMPNVACIDDWVSAASNAEPSRILREYQDVATTVQAGLYADLGHEVGQ